MNVCNLRKWDMEQESMAALSNLRLSDQTYHDNMMRVCCLVVPAFSKVFSSLS